MPNHGFHPRLFIFNPYRGYFFVPSIFICVTSVIQHQDQSRQWISNYQHRATRRIQLSLNQGQLEIIHRGFYFKPRAKSACKSAISSNPTEIRISPSLMPAALRCSGVIRPCVVVAG